MKIKFKSFKIPLLINLICIGISFFLALSHNNVNFISIFKILLITSLNLVILLRIKDSYLLLTKIKKLENLHFPIYKDITIILLGGILFLITYSFLFFDCIGFINIFKPIGEINITYKFYLFIIFLIIITCAFISNTCGVIVPTYFENGVKVFMVKEHTVLYGNEILNRASGSFKNGLIIGYYIFNFKDIIGKYKDNNGNIIITGFNNGAFKIVISAKRSKAYFFNILNIH